MNKEEAEELLPVIEAFIAGKKIEFKPHPGHKWRDFTELNPGFENEGSEWRVKPAKQVKFLTLYKGSGFLTYDEALKNGRGGYRDENPVAIIRVEYSEGEGLEEES